MENIKFKKFLTNAKLLNREYRIIPLLYGSLGLEEITSTDLKSDDIDILIPLKHLKDEGWTKFVAFLESNGYTLIDESEHAFTKDGTQYSYAQIEELKDYAGIDSRDIGIYEKRGIKYKQLSLDQYLIVYQKSRENEYRQNVTKKGEQDEAKVDFIKSKL